MNHIRLVDNEWLIMQLLKEMQLCAEDKGRHRYGVILENMSYFSDSREAV